MNYIYLKEGISKVSAFDSFIDIIHNTYNSNISDCVKPTMVLNIMPGQAYGLLDVPVVISHSSTPTGPIQGQNFLIHVVDFELIVNSLTLYDYVLIAAIPPTNKVLEFEFISNIHYIGRSNDGTLVNIKNGTHFPSHIAVLPIIGFYNVSDTSIYCGAINENMARLPYNCDVTTPTTHIRTVGREDGSLKQTIISPTITDAVFFPPNVIVAPQVFSLEFFGGPYNTVFKEDQERWWKSIKYTINTNLSFTHKSTGFNITPSSKKVGYFHVKFHSGPFCDDSNDPTERFEYMSIIIQDDHNDNTINSVL